MIRCTLIMLFAYLSTTGVGFAQKLSPAKKKVLDEAIKLEDQVFDQCQKLWDYAETALKEEKSADLLISALKQAGFVITPGVATKVLALTGIDLFTDSELREEAKQYFLKKTGGKAYESPLPEGQKVKLPE